MQRKGLAGGDDDYDNGVKFRPTFGVSFGLPGGGGYPTNPYGPYPAVNPYFGSVGHGGLNLGLVSVNPLLSLQVTKDEYGDKVVKPLVNFHVTPSQGLVHKIGSLIHKFKGPYGPYQYGHPPYYHHHHEHSHFYSGGPPPYYPGPSISSFHPSPPHHHYPDHEYYKPPFYKPHYPSYEPYVDYPHHYAPGYSHRDEYADYDEDYYGEYYRNARGFNATKKSTGFSFPEDRTSRSKRQTESAQKVT